jgi:hypothetical protein
MCFGGDGVEDLELCRFIRLEARNNGKVLGGCLLGFFFNQLVKVFLFYN